MKIDPLHEFGIYSNAMFEFAPNIRRLPSRVFQNGWWVIGLFSVSSVLYIAYGDLPLVKTLTIEDGLIEQLSVLFWFCGFITALVKLTSVREELKPKRLLMFWALFCLICGGEEISWGQRLIHFKTPEAVNNVNYQHEFNLHNIHIFYEERKPDDGSWRHFLDNVKSGSVNLPALFLSADKVILYGFMFFFGLIPALVIFNKGERLVDKISFGSPNASFVLSFWFVIGCSFIISLVTPDVRSHPVQEIRELYYALFSMLYVYYFCGDAF